MSTTINEKLETIIEILDQMDKKLERLERSVNTQSNPFVYPGDNTPQPSYPANPFPHTANSTVCGKCGLEFEGATSYYCPSDDCPIF